MYTTGDIDPTDGIWFKDIRIQVRQNFQWIDVTSIQVTPQGIAPASVE